MTTAIYMRVSTERQSDEGVSLQTQKERLNAYCTMKGFQSIKEYLDIGSGRTTDKRINFNRMMNDVKSGFINNIVIFKLDRLTRSIMDLSKLVNRLNDKGCALHSCTENIDTTTPSGRMMINLIGTFAQWESETISERVKVNMQSIAEKGIWQSSIPFGFDLGKDKRLIVNKNEQNILLEAFELVFDGNSFTQAENTIINRYGLDWHRGYLLKKVRSASLVGDIYRNGILIENTHEPLMDKYTRDKLLLIANERGNPRMQIFDGDLFRRKVLCPQCDRILSLRANKDKNGNNLFSYCCHECYRNGKIMLSITEKSIEKAFENYLDKYNIDKVEDINDDKKEANQIKTKLKGLENEKKRIQKAWIKGFIDETDLVEHQYEVDENISIYMDKLEKLDNKPTLDKEKILMLKYTFKDNYNVLTKDEKILLIQNHVEYIKVNRELLEGYKKKYVISIDNIEFY